MKSAENPARRKLSTIGHLAISVLLVVLGLVPQPVFSSTSRDQDSERKSQRHHLGRRRQRAPGAVGVGSTVRGLKGIRGHGCLRLVVSDERMLTDRSDRREGQGIATASSDGRYHVERQIATDRYYAAHLLGDLRDPRAVPILVALLNDREINSIVPWALGQIGDKSAVGSLLDVVDEDNSSMRVLAIDALETLNARERSLG